MHRQREPDDSIGTRERAAREDSSVEGHLAVHDRTAVEAIVHRVALAHEVDVGQDQPAPRSDIQGRFGAELEIADAPRVRVEVGDGLLT
jgi:hypothetical protein